MTQGQGTILDDDIGYGIAFSRSTFHTEEGDDVVVMLQRLVPHEPGFGVCYVTIQGKCFSVATEGHTANGEITVNLKLTQTGDFLSGAAPTTVTFAQGVAEVELSLPTTDDGTVEADGSLSFKIVEGTGYSPVYIEPPDSNDDGMPHRTLYLYDNDLTFSIDDVQADESASSRLDFTVHLNAPAPQEVTVDVATVDGEATSHANVTATSLGQDFEAKHRHADLRSPGSRPRPSPSSRWTTRYKRKSETSHGASQHTRSEPQQVRFRPTVVDPHQPRRRHRRRHYLATMKHP